MSWELHHGDCLAGLRSLPDKSVDHVITDPPYEKEVHTKQRRIYYSGRGVAPPKPLDFAPITTKMRDLIAKEIVRVTRGWAMAFCQIEAVAAWRLAFTAAGGKWRRGAVWVKGGMPQLTGDRPAQGCECIAIAWCGGGRSVWNGGGRPGVWSMSHQADGHTRIHPTQKPLALMEQLVRDFTMRGELICDPFAGGGSTGVAAVRLGRRFLGWELDANYHRVATARLGDVREQFDLFETKNPAGTGSAIAGQAE